MGLVKVKVYSEVALKQCMDDIEVENATDKKKSSQEISPLLIKANKNLGDARSELKAVESTFPQIPLTAQEVDRRMIARRPVQEKIEIAEQELNRVYAIPAPQKKTYWKCVEMAKSVTEAVTDAEGKFEINFPTSGKYALTAFSSRKLPSYREGLNTEFYQWFVWAEMGRGETKKITLSNNNQSDLYAPETDQTIPIY